MEDYDAIDISTIHTYIEDRLPIIQDAMATSAGDARALFAIKAFIVGDALSHSLSEHVQRLQRAAWDLFVSARVAADQAERLMRSLYMAGWLFDRVKWWSTGQQAQPTAALGAIATQPIRLLYNQNGITVYVRKSTVVINVVEAYHNVIMNHQRVARISLDRDLPWMSSVVWPIKTLNYCKISKLMRIKCVLPTPSYISVLDFDGSLIQGVAFAYAICRSVAGLHVCSIAHGGLRSGLFFPYIHRQPPIVAEDISVAFAPVFDHVPFAPGVTSDAPEAVRKSPFRRDIMDTICLCARFLYAFDLRSVASRAAMDASMRACRRAAVARMNEWPMQTWDRIHYYLDRLCDEVYRDNEESMVLALMHFCTECQRRLPFRSVGSFPSSSQQVAHPWVAAAAASMSVPTHELTEYVKKLDQRAVQRAMEHMQLQHRAAAHDDGPAHNPLQMIPPPWMTEKFPVELE
jgi:hypothetical protein